MKKFLLGTVGLMAMAAPAAAADMAARMYTKAPPPLIAVYDWSGFYVGANAGWGSSHSCWDLTSVAGVATGTTPEGCQSPSGATAGGQFGYRWQTGAWVFGMEAQGNWADFKGTTASIFTSGLTSNQSKIDDFGMFSGEIGYAWNNTLLYVKGGAAVTEDKFIGLNSGSAFDTATEDRWGGTVGAGIEYGFAPNWSAAIEYDHLFMGHNSDTFMTTTAPTSLSRTDSIRQDVDLITARINYRWGGPLIGKF
jgi:outer membrane immunogenic protein